MQRACLYSRHLLQNYAESVKLQQQAIEFVKSSGEKADRLLIVRHLPVFTIGRRLGAKSHLLPSAKSLNNVEIVDSSRGGDITYHGPGQVVCYPILDLTHHKKDLKWYVSTLEEAMIKTIAHFGIKAQPGSGNGASGCWVGKAKIGAIGINTSNWITSHGIAINVNDNVLPYFSCIDPCGIKGCKITTIQSEHVRAFMDQHHPQLEGAPAAATQPADLKIVSEEEVEQVFVKVFGELFNLEMKDEHKEHQPDKIVHPTYHSENENSDKDNQQQEQQQQHQSEEDNGEGEGEGEGEGGSGGGRKVKMRADAAMMKKKDDDDEVIKQKKMRMQGNKDEKGKTEKSIEEGEDPQPNKDAEERNDIQAKADTKLADTDKRDLTEIQQIRRAKKATLLKQ